MVFGSSARRRRRSPQNHAPTFSCALLRYLFCCFSPYHSSMDIGCATMERRGTVLMRRYELGRLLGHGTFAKVYEARNLSTGKTVAIKIIDKEKVLRVGMIEQIKREISVMRMVRHPNVVELYEVMATKTKIYFVMECVRGGELFAKVAKGRLREDVSRKYFQQLISAIDFCHSRGVYHRDLKPENLLLDENGNLKVSDFGLTALVETRRQDGLLHTTCGTPAYVAPEVINKKGYDGAKADIWSCGVVLFVLMAGYLPFHDANIIDMYRKISKGEFKCPQWFPSDVKKLLMRILDPNPNSRITISKILENSWFRKGFSPIESHFKSSSSLGDISSVFSTETNNDCSLSTSSSTSSLFSLGSSASLMSSSSSSAMKVTSLNAFDIISRSAGFDLSALFEKDKKQIVEARFTSKKSTEDIVSKLEEVAQMEQFKVEKKDGTVKLEGSKEGRKGLLAVEAEIFEVAPALMVVEVKKTAGDTLEYQKFYHQDLKPSLKDIVWKWQVGDQSPPPSVLPSLPPLPPSSNPRRQ